MGEGTRQIAAPAATPEPATLALLCLGAVAAAVARRRRKADNSARPPAAPGR
ncbi:MAG: PEP-CTERM sorting domain-containing protein [Planctomycetes bacterium]|nr:PEP-CTERM sorting domain-containing protein [Planctomycetota bacterium]